LLGGARLVWLWKPHRTLFSEACLGEGSGACFGFRCTSLIGAWDLEVTVRLKLLVTCRCDTDSPRIPNHAQQERKQIWGRNLGQQVLTNQVLSQSESSHQMCEN
jgi:hypothetical protein